MVISLGKFFSLKLVMSAQQALPWLNTGSNLFKSTNPLLSASTTLLVIVTMRFFGFSNVSRTPMLSNPPALNSITNLYLLCILFASSTTAKICGVILWDGPCAFTTTIVSWARAKFKNNNRKLTIIIFIRFL